MAGFYKLALIFWLGIVLCSCNRPEPKTAAGSDSRPDTATQHYISALIGYDTLNGKQKRALVQQLLATEKGTQHSPYYYYVKGLQLDLAHNTDSALYYYGLMKADTATPDLYALQQYAIFNNNIMEENIVSSDKVSALLRVTRTAEEGKSTFVYLLYDLLAKTYYRNANTDKAIIYTDLYFKHNPLQSSPVIQQRYHDISFMLAAQKNKAWAMGEHLERAQELAIQLGDSLALARTYDYESQLYSLKKQPGRALESSRKFFNYLKQHNLLRKYAFNNMATTFIRNRQPDSAIYYYGLAIQWARQHPGSDLFSEFQGLAEVYRFKQDYKNAAIALDSAINIFGRNTAAIEAEKIEELHTRYQTEKKDQAIASLQTTNRLNRKLITQQRWIFLAASLLLGTLALIVYNTYRRKLLVAKNEKLSAENRKLLLEQKALQLQLDPHFIYNAVANMQGLISSDKKKEANAYLVTFSSLMRNMLELNRQDLISVGEEIGALENYIRLQQMRFEHAFAYRIDTNGLDTEALLIPPMLVQPFVENAIEHGFKNIAYQGMLDITFTAEAVQLHICVSDNGAGPDTQDPSAKKSLSGSIIGERLDVLFNRKEKIAYFNTQSHTAANGKGYRVDLYIPLITA